VDEPGVLVPALLRPTGSQSLKIMLSDRKNYSTPLLSRINSFSFGRKSGVKRRFSEADAVYGKLASTPLHDLAPLALPGLQSRVTKNMSVAMSLDQLGAVFLEQEDIDEDVVVEVESRVTTPLLWATGLSVMCSFQYGWNNANMNTASSAMRADLGLDSLFPETDAVWGLIVAIFCLGGLVGCSLGASAAEIFGRKGALLAMSATSAFGTLLEAASYLPGCAEPPCTSGLGTMLMMVGRVVLGVASGATTVVVPMYLGEISLPHLRGALGTVFQLTCVFAMLVAQVLGLPALMGRRGVWPWYVLINLVPAVTQYLLRARLPESPRWLSGQGVRDVDEAEAVLSLLRGVPADSLEVMQELDFMQQGSGKGSYDIPGYKPNAFSMLRDRSLRRSLLVCCVSLIVQQASGINNAFNYSTTFLSQNGISPSTVTLVAVLMNVGNVFITIVVVYLMDALGRRVLLLASTAGMIVSIFLLTLALTNPGEMWTAPCAVVAVVCFVTSFGIGMGPVPWLLPAEVFPMELSGVGSAVAASSNWLANFAVGVIFLQMSNALGGYCFLPFAVVLIGFFFFAVYRIPETRGKTVDQIMLEINMQ